MLGELVVGFDQLLGLLLVLFYLVPVFSLGPVGKDAQVSQDVDCVGALLLDAQCVGTFDADVYEAVFLFFVRAKHFADTLPETFLLLFLWHMEDGVFGNRGDDDFFFGLWWRVFIDGTVEFG